jgi:hypothetical protein
VREHADVIPTLAQFSLDLCVSDQLSGTRFITQLPKPSSASLLERFKHPIFLIGFYAYE